MEFLSFLRDRGQLKSFHKIVRSVIRQVLHSRSVDRNLAVISYIKQYKSINPASTPISQTRKSKQPHGFMARTDGPKVRRGQIRPQISQNYLFRCVNTIVHHGSFANKDQNRILHGSLLKIIETAWIYTDQGRRTRRIGS